jgi:hypothetical protein
MPCGAEHPCCAYRSPENRSLLPTAIRVPSPEVSRFTRPDTVGDADAEFAVGYSASDLQAYFVRSMVLRI